MWASQHWTFNHPYTWINSGGLGTMGFAVPAAIGAKVGMPERMVWAIDGDGCFQMTAQELVTASAERIPVKIAILNNAYLGMVRQWQELFYEERYSEVYLSPDLPDYVKWAEAMGCVGFRVDTPDDVVPTIEKANEIDDRPVVIDFRTDYREKVYPMVAAGHVERRRDPRSRDRPSGRAADAWTASAPHPQRARGEQVRCAQPRRRAVLAGAGYNIYSLAVSPTEDERYSRMTVVVDGDVGADRAGHQAAQQADPGDQDQRAAADRRGRARAHARDGEGDGRAPLAGHRAGLDLRGQDPRRRLRRDHADGRGRAREARRDDRPARSRSASSSSSGPAGSRCPSWPASPAKLRAVKNRSA